MANWTKPHSISIFGDQIKIGVLRSTEARGRSPYNAALTASRLSSEVDCLSLDIKARPGDGNQHCFEVNVPIAGQRSSFQWRFFGIIVEDGSSARVQGAFRLPRHLEVFFLVWLIFAGVFVAGAVLIAASSEQSEMWFLPLAGIVAMAGWYVTLFVGRAISKPGMRRVALQLDQCFAHNSRA